MPTYDYVCSSCGHEMEVVHGVHGHGPSACPVCGGPMRKSFTVPAVHFKGSGWAKKERGGARALTSKSTGPKADAPSGSGEGGSAEGGSGEGGSGEGGSAAASSGAASGGSTSASAGDPAGSRPD